MSGLVAFTGPPDRKLLDRMIGRLAHRGGLLHPHHEAESVRESPSGSIAVCEWQGWKPPGKVQTGIFDRPSASWALSGFAFSKIPDRADAESFAQLRGSYAVACLHDNMLTIARDSHGCQSLFYGRVHARWLIASEPKAIIAELAFDARIRPAAVAQYLSFSFSPTRQCVLQDLFQAEAGHFIQFQVGREPVTRRYFHFEAFEMNQGNESQLESESDRFWISKTRGTIEQAVADRMPNETPLVFLSGGLDSSIVAAEVARQSSRRIKTFSIHFGKGYPNELEYARAVADRIKSKHEEVLIRPKDFVSRLSQMIWHLDEPIGDPITQPNFELAAHVSEHGSFVFNGEGGDPVFGGPKNLPMMMLHWYGNAGQEENFREKAYLASYRRGYEEWSRLLTDDFRRQIDPVEDLEKILSPFFHCSQPRQFLNKLMAINIRLKGANLILPKVDRMLAAHRLTPLSPLFDERLTQLSFEMPTRMKLRSGIEKYVLKRAYEDLLPAAVIHRPKSGMRVPVHHWFERRWWQRNQLRSVAKSILNRRDIERSGIFNADRVEQLMRYEIEEGPGRYGLRLWMLLTFEMWRKMARV